MAPIAENNFQQLQFELQEHDGAVTGSSLFVEYFYADGSANTIRRTGILPPSGGIEGTTLAYGTGDDDALSRVTSVEYAPTGPVATFTYLGLGSVVKVTNYSAGIIYDLATGAAPNPYAGLDSFGRVIDCRWHTTGGSPTDLVRLIYGYDRASNRTFRQDVVAEGASASFDELYAYDPMQRLKTFNRGTLASSSSPSDSSPSPSTGEGRGEGATGEGARLSTLALRQDWHLDATGNWSGFQQFDQSDPTQALDQQRTSNTANEILGITNSVGPVWANPIYDRAGNMTSIPRPADMETAFGGVWDAWGRLVKVNVAEDTLQQNAYDGLGRRITQSTTPIAWETFTLAEWESFTLSDWESFTLYGTTTLRHYYYSDQWQSLEERLGDDPITAPMDRQFVWGLRYVDDLAVRIRQIDSSNTLLFAMQDANWNVAANCNSSAAVQERYAYTAYGVPQFLAPDFTARSSSSFDWETLFCAYRYDAATGLYHVRYRDLQPVIGSWISQDEPSYMQLRGVYNPYQYCVVDPINNFDPTGLANEHLDVSVFKETLGDCGDAEYLIKMQLNPQSPCVAVLIQENTIFDDTQQCPCGACPNLALPKNPSDKPIWEYLGIIVTGTNETSLQAKLKYNDDRGLVGGGAGTCGKFRAVGELRAYCATKPNVKLFGEVLQWKKGKDETPPIPTGDAQASRTEPKLWKNKADYTKVYSIDGDYDCCSGKRQTNAKFIDDFKADAANNGSDK